MTRTTANDWWIPNPEVVTRVTLTGPRADKNNDNPSQFAKLNLPQTFELVGRDSVGNEVVKYGFVLQKWFVNRGNVSKGYPEQASWCSRLGYSMPRVKDLTNSKCGVEQYYFPCIGVDGATPSSSGDYYQRRIGAGFFTEWGNMPYYEGGEFFPLEYWTSDEVASGNQFVVYSVSGDVAHHQPRLHSVVCIAP
ncbi:hypothetical protein [Gilliamella sp. Pas-s25]|uniref:hypothetical protein n=1 Tax=Gilliamella sp. Pas-s25 TaxID=2687310 RepID=UPI00135DC5E5|nr:hypothetical protein [Gilliamella sp. Pas-s25]MWP61354.1 hypothetical protein [Gilliamella sp. Pas-s25]